MADWIEKNSWMAAVIGFFSLCGILIIHMLAKGARVAS